MPRRMTGPLVALATLVLLLGTVTPASAAVLTAASDSFSRTVANGLGTADTGGAWTLAGTASRFAVAGGTATISTPASAQYSGYLGSTALRDTDVSATLGVRSLPVGGSMYIGVLARHTASTEYTGRVVVSATGAVTIGLLAGATSLKSVAVAGLTVTPTTTLRIRLQTIGANPTTVQARVWRLGAAEPSTWQVSASDGTAGPQVAGAVGIRTYLSSGATNGPVVGTVDDLAASSSTPANMPPTAGFSVTPTGLTAAVDGSASTDPDGTIASYAWSFGDGGTASGVTASHTYAAAGTYPVTLTVTDDGGATGTTSETVAVSAPAVPVPVAAFTVTSSGLALAVDGSASSDAGGTIAGYAWSFGDGGTASGSTATHTFTVAGTYMVTLVVTDVGGATGTAQQSVTVAPVDQPPVPSLLEQQTGLAATFFGDASTDPDGTVAAYAWTFGDGATSTASDPSHTYAAAGTYPVALTVTDDAGATATVSRSVTVFASGVQPTQAQWLADAGDALTGATDVLDAQKGESKPAIVLDIDNTALQSTYQPFAATTPVLTVEQRAIADGYTILFATGRTADTGGTLKQLTAAGYRVDALCFKDPAAASVQASKIACRNAWAAQGYTIVADVGNHTTDLLGGNSGREYLLPNYGFLD